MNILQPRSIVDKYYLGIGVLTFIESNYTSILFLKVNVL